jgi:hypothetical protein
MDNGLKICFSRTNIYIFALAFSLCLFIYINYYFDCKKHEFNDAVKNITNEIQKVRSEIVVNEPQPQIDSRFLEKIFNPLYPPENIIPQGGFYNKGYDGYQQFQQLGFITNSQGQFPVYGRYKDPNRSDRYEYYTINEGRNSIKIPFSTKGNVELYSGDEVVVPELPGNDFTFKKYENEGMRYRAN